MVDTMTFVRHGEAIRDLAEELTGEKVAVIVNSHWHLDHTHGNPAFDGSERIVSTARTKRHLETLDAEYWQGDAASTLPNESFEDSHLIRIGEKTIQLIWPGRGHTDGDLVALFVEDRTVHMGDLFFNRLYPNIDLEAGGSVGIGRITARNAVIAKYGLSIGHAFVTVRQPPACECVRASCR